jgi:hypothetical protein
MGCEILHLALGLGMRSETLISLSTVNNTNICVYHAAKILYESSVGAFPPATSLKAPEKLD